MTTEKILCVDDDQIVLFSYQRDLHSRFTIVTASSGEEALSILQSQGPFGVIVADMMMPGMNGVELLAQAQRLAPDTVRIMLTGDEDKQTAVEAINEGRIFRFLSKPCPTDKLILTLRAGLEQYRLILAEKVLLEETLNGSVKMLTELLSAAEPKTFGRGQRICEHVRTVAPALNLTQTWDIEVAAMLAQIGFMTIPSTVTQKLQAKVALTDKESEMMARIPEIGSNVLSKIARLGPAAEIVRYQNKNFDGTGFPADRKNGVEIPAGARLLKILSDLVDLDLKGIPKRQAFEHMKAAKGVYDKSLLEAVTVIFVKEEKPLQGAGLPLEELKAGHELLAPVETLDGRLLAPAGTILSPMMLQRFHNFAELSGVKQPIFVRG